MKHKDGSDTVNILAEEAKTFNRLRRIPFEKMEEHLKNVPRQTPLFSLGGQVFESRKHELVRHYELIRMLEKYGWNFEDYVLEIEKRNIMEAIDQYNRECSFPQELVMRAKEFFPNARFTQAKIELE